MFKQCIDHDIGY